MSGDGAEAMRIASERVDAAASAVRRSEMQNFGGGGVISGGVRGSRTWLSQKMMLAGYGRQAIESDRVSLE